jgi:hypothetical protein
MKQPREEFDSDVRRTAWDRANGRCEGIVEGLFGPVRCSAPIDLGEFHYDHIIPYWMCRDSSLDNCQVLCRECHKFKTKGDVKNIAKVKRIKDKRIKARKPKGRPMMGTKRSGWKKPMHGPAHRR